MKNVRAYLTDVYDKTGIATALLGAGGELRFCTPDFPADAKIALPRETSGVVTDEQNGLTFTKVRAGEEVCYAVLTGCGKIERNYAELIASALELGSKNEGKIEDKIRLLLLGELSAAQENMLKAQLADVKFNHYMLSLVTATRAMQEGLRSFLEAIAEKNDYIVTMDECTLLFFRHAGEGGEYRSADEFAAILYENVKEEQRIDLTVSTGGTIKSFRSIPGCYERVLLTHKYGAIVSPGENVHFYKDFVLLSLLSDLPKQTLEKSLDSLLERNAESVFSDRELMETAEEFMKNSLNISETSRNMYVHRNTLIYRLDKIENETGLNLRKFSDALAFRFIKILNSLVKGEKQ